jgi:hypothetical protein
LVITESLLVVRGPLYEKEKLRSGWEREAGL